MKKLLLFLMLSLTLKAGSNDIISENLSLPLSQEAVDLIIYYEVGGRSYYNAKFTRPIVPAWQTTSSGVTVGFGFDCGYNTKEQIAKALEGSATDSEIKALQSVSGLKGRRAYYEGLPKVKNTVHITYEEAEQIFKKDSLPRFTKQTADAFDLTKNRLHPHSNGALTSLVFNRGPSLANTESRKEMRWIKYNISIKREDLVPSNIKSMKRLWSYTKLKGLHLRRDAEVRLFQKGLDESSSR
jgi:GH24 family phage-related lysozyme (muramidase)